MGTEVDRLEDLVEDLQSEHARWRQSVRADRHQILMTITTELMAARRALTCARYERAKEKGVEK
jgi:hypothetical protein